MAVLYKARQAMMANKEGKKLWHPTVVTTGTVNLEKLSAEIADLSSLSEGDVYNVCKNLVKVMARHLQSSEVVQVDGLGNFRLSMRSVGKGFLTSDEVNAQYCALRVKFLPSSTRNNDGTLATRAMTAGTTFKRIDQTTGTGTSSGGSNSGSGSGSPSGGSGSDNTGGSDSGSGGDSNGGGNTEEGGGIVM